MPEPPLSIHSPTAAVVLIATENSSLGMGGPAITEGGGLGSFQPEEVDPIDVQTENGVDRRRARARS